ncbi:MAG TPA: hypothetical protein PL104_04950 [Caldisericia bacterium]|nr:hypothetical protein [Caldisericia bacterium]HQP00003.1 hypothetical protein [Caldisericia bacterium]
MVGAFEEDSDHLVVSSYDSNPSVNIFVSKEYFSGDVVNRDRS